MKDVDVRVQLDWLGHGAGWLNEGTSVATFRINLEEDIV